MSQVKPFFLRHPFLAKAVCVISLFIMPFVWAVYSLAGNTGVLKTAYRDTFTYLRKGDL